MLDHKPLATLRPTERAIDESPTWDEVVLESNRLRVAAAQYDAAVVAGLAGDSVDMTLIDHWPTDVKEGFEHLGLYDRYSPTTIHGVVSRLSLTRQQHLTSNVKGTVFEHDVVRNINIGKLDVSAVDGAQHAELAPSTTQPGWDASLTDDHGNLVGHLQMKATDSPAYLAHHLTRYPEYPNVVTTHEVATRAHDLGGHIIDSGVSNADLTDHVQNVVDHIDAAHVLHEFVPEFALIAILAAAALRLKAGDDRATVGHWVVEQASISGVANAAALAAQVATGTVVVRPVVTLGTRFAIARAKTGRAVANRVAEIRSDLTAIPGAFQEGLSGEEPEPGEPH